MDNELQPDKQPSSSKFSEVSDTMELLDARIFANHSLHRYLTVFLIQVVIILVVVFLSCYFLTSDGRYQIYTTACIPGAVIFSTPVTLFLNAMLLTSLYDNLDGRRWVRISVFLVVTLGMWGLNLASVLLFVYLPVGYYLNLRGYDFLLININVTITMLLYFAFVMVIYILVHSMVLLCNPKRCAAKLHCRLNYGKELEEFACAGA